MAKRILIIDDDHDFSDACANLLEASGYESGYENEETKAMRKIQDFKPDLIILDVVMKSETSGFKAAGDIYADEKLKGIPILFLTGYFKKAALMDKEKELIKKWPNVKGVLGKPVKPAVLLSSINKVLKGEV